MEVFAPENLPGVGMGSLGSIAAVCGLIGLAVTSGALVAEGVIGTLLFVLSALAVLQEKPDFGGNELLAFGLLIVILLAVAARAVLEIRARRAAAGLAGAAADAPETRTLRASIARRERWARLLAAVAVVLAGAGVGFAWAEWNEAPFRLEDGEAFAGILIGAICAAIGGDAVFRFTQGAVRAGGSPLVIGLVVVIIAYLFNVLSVYVAFFGAIVLLLAAVLAWRLRRRQQQKYAGLRILS